MKLNGSTSELFVLLDGTNGSAPPGLETWKSLVSANYENRRIAAAASLDLPPTATWLEIMARRREHHCRSAAALKTSECPRRGRDGRNGIPDHGLRLAELVH